jgi:2-polyprenyl-6-methoxyphenol hydroxylase-like FAD-dependent oxidoreductase
MMSARPSTGDHTPTVVVAGGSTAGLVSALAMAGHGMRVVVLERAPEPPDGPPGEAGQRWARPTVPNGLHAHTLTSLGMRTLCERAPELLAALIDAGATVLDLTRAMPSGRSTRVPGDEELLALACRRSTLDLVLHRVVRALPGVAVRHGVRVRGLRLDDTRGHVTGVVTTAGTVPCDVVVDATGRRALGRAWLLAEGHTVDADVTSPSGVRAYSRFYRRLGPAGHLNRGNAAGVLGDHYAGVLHQGDGDTFSVALGVLPQDTTMRSLRHPDAFQAVASSTPWVTDWLGGDRAVPISGIRAITCPPNVLRGLAVSTHQPVAGLFPVGDAACITNPLFGRGLSLALAHAFDLADLVAAHPAVDHDLSLRAARLARDLLTPWYRQSTEDDADRITRWRAAMTGDRQPPLPDRLTLRTVGAAAGTDATVWRGVTKVLMTLRSPQEVFTDADFVGRVRDVVSGVPAPRSAAPTRADLVAAVAGWDG